MSEPLDAELLACQAALQAEAASILLDLDLFALIAPLGHPTQTGSSALGLMVARDIDVTTICPSLEVTTLAILRIKGAWHDRQPRVRSYRVYDAVLDHGVRTLEDFRTYLDVHT